MNSINLRLFRIKRTQKKTDKPRCLRSRYCWNDREGAGNLGNYYHRENSLKYGTVCLMARCYYWWELLWSKDEEIFTSRSKIHWHWRDQGPGKMVLNASPPRHKEFTLVMSEVGEKKSLHVTHKGRTQRGDSYRNRSEGYTQAQCELPYRRVFQKWHQRGCWEWEMRNTLQDEKYRLI